MNETSESAFGILWGQQTVETPRMPFTIIPLQQRNSRHMLSASHDGAVLGGVLSEGLGRVVVACPTVGTEAALPRPASQGTVRVSVLARKVAHAAPGTVLTGVGTAGEAPVDNGWRRHAFGNDMDGR